MDWFINLKLTSKLKLIILVFSLGMVIFGFIAYQTIEKLRVNGDMYLQIVQGKDLIADILPPPDYIVESYLNAFQMLDEPDNNILQNLIEKSKSLREEYNVRHEVWVEELAEDEMKENMVKNSYIPAVKFYDLRDERFIPLILAGKKDEARVLLNSEMKTEYEIHRSYIDKVVAQANKNNAQIEEEARELINSRTWSLVLTGIGILVILFFIVSQIFKNISNPINKVLEMVQELAKGNVKARANIISTDEVGTMAKTIDEMAKSLDDFAVKLNNIAEGDVSVKAEVAGENDALGPALNAISSTLKYLIEQINEMTKAALNGELNKRSDEEKFQGGYKAIISGINATLDAMVKPLNESRLILEEMAKGDLTVKMKGDYNGDFAIIKNSINGLADSFKEAISDVVEAVHATASASNQISSSIEEMAAGSEEQNNQISEVASAIEQMSKTIFETTQNASLASETARKAGEIAKDGEAVVSQTLDGMNNIADVVEKSAQTVHTLGINSDKIGEIIQVIDEIADQTNLLALNAAIEAARAGEQGRGFAVVADEVRKLAERTTNATKEIASMIKQIQQDTSGAVESMKIGTEEVHKGKVLSDKADKSLKEILYGSTEVVDMVQQLKTANEEQNIAAERISKNIEAISSVVQQSSAGFHQIANAAGDMNNLAVNLEKLVSRFTLSSEISYLKN